jgi:hypothetical protein
MSLKKGKLQTAGWPAARTRGIPGERGHFHNAVPLVFFMGR